jgi:hypothetical protein
VSERGNCGVAPACDTSSMPVDHNWRSLSSNGVPASAQPSSFTDKDACWRIALLLHTQLLASHTAPTSHTACSLNSMCSCSVSFAHYIFVTAPPHRHSARGMAQAQHLPLHRPQQPRPVQGVVHLRWSGHSVQHDYSMSTRRISLPSSQRQQYSDTTGPSHGVVEESLVTCHAAMCQACPCHHVSPGPQANGCVPYTSSQERCSACWQ